MMLKRFLCAALAVTIFALALSGCGETKEVKEIDLKSVKFSSSQTSELQNQFDTMLKDAAFSGQSIVRLNDQEIFSDCRGYTNREKTSLVKMNTRMRIGALTETFTAVATQMLIDSGKLRPDDTLDNFFNTDRSVRKYLRNVTVSELMDRRASFGIYTSEFVTVHGNYKYITARLKRSKGSLRDYIRDKILNRGLHNRKNAYSNYYLLGLIIEQASGKSYKDFVQKNIFDKLGMKNSGFVGSGIHVSGYYAYIDKWVDEKYLPAYNDFDYAFSTLGIVSTAEDLEKFYHALIYGELTKDSVLDTIKNTPRGFNFGLEADGSVLTAVGGTTNSGASVCINPDRRELAISVTNTSNRQKAQRLARSMYDKLNAKLNGFLLDSVRK